MRGLLSNFNSSASMKNTRASAFWLLFFPFSVLLMAGTCANAQATKPAPLIYCVSYAPGLSPLFTKQADGRYEDAGVSTANIVELASAALVNGTLSLYGPSGDNGQHPLAAMVALSSTSHPLIVLNPAAVEAKPPYTATVLDAAPAKFPLGSYHVVNLSPHPIRITLGKNSVEVPAASSHVYHPKRDDGETLSITINYKPEKEWLLLSSSNWANRQDRRTLVCIVEDNASKRMAIKSIPLRPEPTSH